MTEFSLPWGGEVTGDAGPYTDDHWSDFWRNLFTRNLADDGVLLGVGGDLDVTAGAGLVTVAAGRALVDGKYYINDAAANVAIPTPSGATRIDRIVLRKTWIDQEVRITRIAGAEGGAAPAMTQSDGTAWDIPLARVSITTGGAITVTVDRRYIQPGFDPTPSGVMLPYGGTTAPAGYLLCYGQAVSRTTYAKLFAAISTNYGVGDGSTTFNLPDLRGRVPAGKDDMGGAAASRLTGGATMGAAGGAETHTLTTAQMPAHSHQMTASPVQGGAGTNRVPDSTGAPTYYNTLSEGGGGAHNNLQPYQIATYIIKI